jgi:hypothetical protein
MSAVFRLRRCSRLTCEMRLLRSAEILENLGDSHCQGEGRGFESRRPLHREVQVSSPFGGLVLSRDTLDLRLVPAACPHESAAGFRGRASSAKWSVQRVSAFLTGLRE